MLTTGSIMGLGLLSLWFGKYFLGLAYKSVRFNLIPLLITITLAGIYFGKFLKPASIYLQPDSRSRIYGNLWQASLQKPWWGWGWAKVDAAFGYVKPPDKLLNDIYVDKAHGELLEWLVTGGVVGLLIYLIFWFVIFGKSYGLWQSSPVKKREFYWSLLSVFALFFLYSQTNIISVSQNFIIWVWVGYLLVQEQPTNIIHHKKHSLGKN